MRIVLVRLKIGIAGLTALGAVTGLVLATPALAGKTDDGWAQCLWANAPETSANWLAMTPTKDRFGLGNPPPEMLLQYRLQAACHTALTPDGKRGPPSFNAKRVRRSLEESRPATVGTEAVDPRAYQCTRYFLNDTEMKTPAEYRWGVGDPGAGVTFSRVQYFFAGSGNSQVGLPETGGLERCQFIQSDGTLVDA